MDKKNYYAGKKKFGVYIPAWKPLTTGRPCGQAPPTCEFVLSGWVPSKKNLQIPTFNYTWVFKQIRSFLAGKKQIPSKEWLKFTTYLIKHIKPYIMNPPRYQVWEKETIDILVQQAAVWRETYQNKYPGFSFPITRGSIRIRHYWADKHRRDNSNKAESIHDALVAAGIIADDKYECLFQNSAEAQCYKDEITDHVTQIFITCYQW